MRSICRKRIQNVSVILNKSLFGEHCQQISCIASKETGAGDAFFAGTVIGLTYGKTLAQACEIGSRLAASVICISENVCPRFRPAEFGLDVPVTD